MTRADLFRKLNDLDGFTPRSALAQMALLRAKRAAEYGDEAAFTAAIVDAYYFENLAHQAAS